MFNSWQTAGKVSIIGYSYDADFHCLDCALAAFPDDVLAGNSKRVLDNDGNAPHPIFGTDEIAYDYDRSRCGTCGEELK